MPKQLSERSLNGLENGLKEPLLRPYLLLGVCFSSYSLTAHFGPILLMRGGRFIHGGESGDHSNPLFLIWKRPQDDTTGAVSFSDCAAHDYLSTLPTKFKPPFRSSVRATLRMIVALVVLLAKHGWRTTSAFDDPFPQQRRERP